MRLNGNRKFSASRITQVSFLIFLGLTVVAFQNCSVASSATPAPDVSATAVVTCTFNGASVANGASVTAYLNSTDPVSCVTQTRTCANGSLDGSYAYASCSLSLNAACLFNGTTVASGTSVVAYQDSTVPYRQSCSFQTRVCTNGQLSGSDPYASCTPQTAASCLFNGSTILSGQTVTGYSVGQVPYGQLCSAQAQIRTCTNGLLDGSASYGLCTAAAGAACLFNGQTLADGESTIGYAASIAAYGYSCSKVQSQLTCKNGTLANADKYPYSSCSTQAGASCSIAGQTVKDGSSIITYPQYTVAYGTTCAATALTSTCANGVPSNTGPYTVCVVGPPPIKCNVVTNVSSHVVWPVGARSPAIALPGLYLIGYDQASCVKACESASAAYCEYKPALNGDPTTVACWAYDATYEMLPNLPQNTKFNSNYVPYRAFSSDLVVISGGSCSR